MRACLLLGLLTLAGAACGPASDDVSPSPAPTLRDAAPPRPVRPLERLPDEVPTDDLESPPVEFDTVPPAAIVAPPPPRPAPARPPPLPLPDPPPAPAGDAGVAGSCDVRGTESYCFAYAGPGWTPADARRHCSAAPASTFAAGACPASQRVATCTFERPDAPGQSLVYTYYAPYPLDLARLACPGQFDVLP